MYIKRPFDRELPNIQLYMDKEANTMSLQYALVNDGIVKATEEKVHQSFTPSVNELNKVMGFAKESGFGGWAIHESV